MMARSVENSLICAEHHVFENLGIVSHDTA